MLGWLYILDFKLITLFMNHEVWILSLLIIYDSCTVEVPWLKKWEALTTLYPHYRGYNSLIDTSLTDNGVDLPVVDWSDSSSLDGFCSVRLWKKYDGCRSGDGKEAEWLLSMRTMDAIVGLSTGSSCTDNTLIWRGNAKDPPIIPFITLFYLKKLIFIKKLSLMSHQRQLFNKN